MQASRPATAAVLVAWCLVAVGDGLNAGYFTAVASACVLLGVVILGGVAACGRPLAAPDRAILVVPIAVGFAAAVADPSGAYLYLDAGDRHVLDALAAMVAAAAGLSLIAPAQWRRRVWWVALALAAATGIVTIAVIDNPGIDVWQLLQQSSTGLLHGDDLYRQHWVHSTGLQAVYPYLPLSTILVAPFRWITGDVRYGLLAATLVTAWLLARRNPEQPAVASLLFVVPAWPLLVNRSWTEPLLILALAATVLAIRAGRSTLAVLALGIALATKQPVILLLPVFASWPSFGLRRTVAACGVALVAVLPWVIAGPRDFWHDAVHAELVLAVRRNSLGLPTLLLRHGDRVGFWLLAAALLLAYVAVAWRAPRTPSGLALSCAVVSTAYDLANKQTYFNHWMLPLGLIVVALAVAEPAARPVSRRSRPPRPVPAAE